eukprot:scaffold1753_cov153-Amphora_coffeaeformis.AAC.6
MRDTNKSSSCRKFLQQEEGDLFAASYSHQTSIATPGGWLQQCSRRRMIFDFHGVHTDGKIQGRIDCCK